MLAGPVFTFVLIEAGEGYTEHVYVAHGADLSVLQTLMATRADALVARDRTARPEWGTWCQYHASRGTALLALLERLGHPAPGRYVFPPQEPFLWGEVTLIIAACDRAYVDETAILVPPAHPHP